MLTVLPEIVTLLLTEARVPDPAVMMRTGHCQVKSLKNY